MNGGLSITVRRNTLLSHHVDFLIPDVVHLGFMNWDIYSMSKVVIWFTSYLFLCRSVIKMSRKENLRCLFTFVAVAMLSAVVVCAVGQLPQHRRIVYSFRG